MFRTYQINAHNQNFLMKKHIEEVFEKEIVAREEIDDQVYYTIQCDGDNSFFERAAKVGAKNVIIVLEGNKNH